MLRETERCIKRSIQKWVDIRENDGEEAGEENCALCQRFEYTDSQGRCSRDHAKTGETLELCPLSIIGEQCIHENEDFNADRDKSAYEVWTQHQHVDHDQDEYESHKATCCVCYVLADNMIDALKSCLTLKESGNE